MVSVDGDLSADHAMWEEFRQKALIATNNTQAILKNLSGIPYPITISRSAIEADFNYFLNSDYQFFCLTGSSGVGKSVQMVQLVDKFFLGDTAPFRDSIIWFLKSPTLKKLEPYDFDFEETTKDQFEIGKKFTFLQYFKDHPAEVKGKLMLVLDGFDEHTFEAAELEGIFQKIIDLLCYAQGCNWLKIVVSLRTSTWALLQKRINESEYLKKTWFAGVFYQKEARSNLTPLNKAEVQKGLKAIQDEVKATSDVSECASLHTLFAYPFFMHLYFQVLKKNPDTVLRGGALYCELVASFVFQKIYQSGYSVEKIQIIRKLIKATDFGKSDLPIERRVLFEANDLYVLGYNELLNEGILLEKNVDSLFNYRIYVQFLHESIFTYFIAQDLIDKNKEFSSIALFKKVMHEYHDEEQRAILLQWIILHTVVDKPQDMMGIVFHDLLSPIERGRLFTFICDLLEENPNLLEDRQKNEFIEKSILFLATHFLELDRIGPEHEDAIQTLINNVSVSIDEANLLILQGVIAIARLDKIKLSSAIARLRKLDRNLFTESYPLHPVRAMEFIYQYYSLESNTEFFSSDITNFIEYPPETDNHEKLDSASLLSYQLGIFASIFSRSPKQSIAFTDVVKYLHPGLFSLKQSSGVSMYLLMRQAFAYLRCQMKSQARKILDQLQKCQPLFSIEKNYSHSIGLYEILRGEIALSDHNLKQAAGHFLMAYKFSKHSGFIMLQVYAALPLIRVYKELKDFDAVTKLLDDLKDTIDTIAFPIEKILLSKIMEEV